MRPVVVTGLGVVTSVGAGREAFWSNLTAGRSGIGAIQLFDASSFPVRIGGEVRDFDSQGVRDQFPAARNVRDRKVLLGLTAAVEAIADAGLDQLELAPAILSLGVGLEVLWLGDLTPHVWSPDMGAAIASSMLKDGSGRLLQTPLDLTAEILGERYGLLGGRHVNCSACAAGTQAVGEAWQLLAEGCGEVALAGAADSMLNPLGLGGFSLLRVLSDENEAPERACRPFDATRQGTVLGEGAAFLVLETREHATRRGAKVYAEILGYGSSLDGFRVSDPDPDGKGAVESMRRALRSADLSPEDVDCVNAHGTGTPKNDVVETAAIREVLGGHAHEIPVHSVKSMTGHMIAASGAVEAVVAVLTLTCRTVPPTINLERPDPECDLDYVAEGARILDGRTVLSNSFGFGGQNATLIFGRSL